MFWYILSSMAAVFCAGFVFVAIVGGVLYGTGLTIGKLLDYLVGFVRFKPPLIPMPLEGDNQI